MKIDEGQNRCRIEIVISGRCNTWNYYNPPNSQVLSYKLICIIFIVFFVSDLMQSKIPPKQISPKILYFLLVLLCLTWYLCYQSELRIPSVKDQELLGRLKSPNITIQELSGRIDHMYGRRAPSSNSIKNKQKNMNNIEDHDHTKNKNPSSQTNGSPCIILNHRLQYQNWFGSFLSIIAQIQHVPSLSLYYVNNIRGSRQIQSYLSSNDIHSSLVYFESIQNNSGNFNFVSLVEIAKTKCQDSSLVLFMDDVLMLTGDDIIKTVQEAMDREGGVFGYGILAVINKQRNSISLGQSYPYPSQVISRKDFKQYPFVINGPLIVSFPFLEKITCKYCKSPNGHGQLSFRGAKAAISLQILENSQGKIIYIDDVLAVVNEESAQKFVTDANFRNELEKIQKNK